MIDNHKAANVPCSYHCEGGWLPDDGETQDISFDEGDGFGPYSTISMLWPTTFIPCFTCNPDSWANSDLNTNCN